jgi:hypothetical protein
MKKMFVLWSNPYRPHHVMSHVNEFVRKLAIFHNEDGFLFADGLAIIELGKSTEFYQAVKHMMVGWKWKKI